MKCDVPIDNDSLINIAVNYYSENGPDSLLMHAAFYQGYVRNLLNDCTGAIVPATLANDLAKKVSDDYWRAKSAELLGQICHASYLHDESISFFHESAYFYERAGKDLNHLFALSDVANAFSRNDAHEKASRLFDSLYAVVRLNQYDFDIKGYILQSWVANEVQSGKPVKLDYILSELKSSECVVSKAYEAIIAHAASMNGEPLDKGYFEAMVAEPQATVDEKLAIWELLFYLSRKSNNWKSALIYADSLVQLQNKVVHETIKQSVYKASRDHFEGVAQGEHDRAEAMHRLMIEIVFTVLVLLFLVGYITYMRIRSQRRELTLKIQEIYSMSSAMELKAIENERLKHNISESEENRTQSDMEYRRSLGQADHILRESQMFSHNLFRHQWATINNICRDLNEFDTVHYPPKKILTKLQAEIKSISKDENVDKLERFLDSHFNNVMARLRKQCAWMSPSDLRFVMFVFSGFSATAVSVLLDMTTGNFYTKRRRLGERILASGCDDAGEFVALLRGIK